MINVLHVISDTNIGGAGMLLITLVKMMDKSQFNVYIACPKNSLISKMINFEKVNIIEVEQMEGDKSFSKSSVSALIKIIKDNKINIVHTHASLSGRIAAKIAGAKIVYTRHTPGAVYKKNSLKWVINKYLNIFLCDRVIAVSKYIQKQLIDFGIPENKITTIYNGIDISEFEKEIDIQEIKRQYKINDEFIIVEVARVEEGKGHRFLLEAASQLDDSIKYKIFCVGDGSKRHDLEQLVKDLKISDKVVFTGTIKDIKPYLKMSSAVVLPSLFEAFGLTLVEGMCMSKPCIASNVDGIPEVIDNRVNGILVEPKNSEQLKNAILELYNNQELRDKMGQEGKRIVLEKFNAKLMTDNVQKIYSELVEKNSFI